ncbi:MAG TPA: hypothetical protein VGM09_12420 [Bradyrhizobium sp.]|jgi:hypothetical protein
MVRHGLNGGFGEYEISALAAAWIVPLLSRGIDGVSGIPLGLVALLARYVLALRAALEHRRHRRRSRNRAGVIRREEVMA